MAPLDRERWSESDEVRCGAVPILVFDDWFRAEFGPVLALVYGLTGRRWAAEEITQDAFLEAHRRWADVSEMSNPEAWVRTVAMNRARSWSRRLGAETRALTRLVGQRRIAPEELPDDSETFWAAVRELPSRQAEVIGLYYLEDRSVDSIVDMLDLSSGTVKTHLHRGRAALGKRLGCDEEDQ